MNYSIPPSARDVDGRDGTVNRLFAGELLDLYAAVLIVVPVAALLRYL